jgi:hypothetical protein
MSLTTDENLTAEADWTPGPPLDTTDDTVYAPSTWSVLYPDGKVEHQIGAATDVAIRKALRGYAPLRIALDADLDGHLHAWRAEVVGADVVANYPARAILAGHLTGPTTLVGPIVLAGVDGRGLPGDVLARLETFDLRARS